MKQKLLSVILLTTSIVTYAQTTVTSGVTGKVWLDRNLGATQVATSSTDLASAGDLYEWGRDTDGHQLRTASLIAGPVASAAAAGANAVKLESWNWPADWLSPQDGTLWSETGGPEDPCTTAYPSFRLPTTAELQAEITGLSITDAATAFSSVLKLPFTGYRGYYDGVIYDTPTSGWYWTSTPEAGGAGSSGRLFFDSSGANMGIYNRGAALAVRCIQDAALSTQDTENITFEMYPNPAKSGADINFSISDAVENVKVSVYDVTGKEVYNQENQTTKTINLSNASKGFYLVKFVLDNETIVVKELIIE